MRWIRIGLQIFGGLSLLALMAIAAWVSYSYSGMSERVNAAKNKDALFILNWGGISTHQDFKVIGSYQSSRSFTGDYLDYYCIELPKFEVTGSEKEEWHDGPEKNPLLAEALRLGVEDARLHARCFPSPEKMNSEAMKIMFVSVTLNGHFPTAANIIMYDANNRMLYYVGYKT